MTTNNQFDFCAAAGRQISGSSKAPTTVIVPASGKIRGIALAYIKAKAFVRKMRGK